MHILLSAFSISARRGSEWGVGWEFASRLARHHDVTVLYGDLTAKPESQIDMESWMEEHPDWPRMRLVYVPSDHRIQILERLHSKPGLRSLYYTGYKLWQKRALAVARELHRERPFDLVHQLTYATYREPGYLWKLGIPYFWGPFSGGSVIPLQYASILGVKGLIEAVGRWVLNRLTLLTRPRIKNAARKAAHIWCVSKKEQAILSPFSREISLMMEVGTVEADPVLRTLSSGETLRVVWSGVHVPRKALPLLVRAVARLGPGSALEVHVLGAGYGKGEDTLKAKQLAVHLGVADRFTWHGMLSRDEAIKRMRSAHTFLHTSLLEGTSTVILEALSLGLPVICHDACGMATAITPECGIKVPMSGVEASVRGFAEALGRMLERPALVQELSRGAAQRASALRWEPKIVALEEVYARVCSAPGKRP